MEFIRFIKEITCSEIVSLSKKITGSDKLLSIKSGNTAADIIIGVSDGRYAVGQTLCFLERLPENEKSTQLKQTCIITNQQTAAKLTGHNLIIVDDPRALFIDLLSQLKQSPGFACFSSLVDVEPEIHKDSQIHSQAVIEPGVYIAQGAVINAGCVIKQGTYIGRNVTIRENTTIGTAGITVYKTQDDRVLRFPHIAGVIIGDEVEIGASCVIAKGVMSSTVIGNNSVIGNLSNIGHGVNIGHHVWMSVGSLIGGNTKIGERSTLGLGVSVRDNLKIGHDCSIGMGAVVVKDVQTGDSMFGNPAKKMRKINAGPKR